MLNILQLGQDEMKSLKKKVLLLPIILLFFIASNIFLNVSGNTDLELNHKNPISPIIPEIPLSDSSSDLIDEWIYLDKNSYYASPSVKILESNTTNIIVDIRIHGMIIED